MGIEIDEPLVAPVFAAETVHAGPARLPDPALPDHRDGLALDFRPPPPGVGHDQQDAGPVAGFHHGVHLGRGARQRLFRVHVDALFGGGQHHGEMVAHLVGGQDDDVQLLLLQHIRVPGVACPGAGALQRGLPSVLDRIGQGGDLRALHAHEGLVKGMPVVAAARMSDDAAFQCRAPVHLHGGRGVAPAIDKGTAE